MSDVNLLVSMFLRDRPECASEVTTGEGDPEWTAAGWLAFQEWTRDTLTTWSKQKLIAARDYFNRVDRAA